MEIFGSSLSAMDLHRRVSYRAEDMKYMDELHHHRRVNDKRREVEQKAEILKVRFLVPVLRSWSNLGRGGLLSCDGWIRFLRIHRISSTLLPFFKYLFTLIDHWLSLGRDDVIIG